MKIQHLCPTPHTCGLAGVYASGEAMWFGRVLALHRPVVVPSAEKKSHGPCPGPWSGGTLLGDFRRFFPQQVHQKLEMRWPDDTSFPHRIRIILPRAGYCCHRLLKHPLKNLVGVKVQVLEANFATTVLRRKRVLSGPRCRLLKGLGQTALKSLF